MDFNLSEYIKPGIIYFDPGFVLTGYGLKKQHRGVGQAYSGYFGGCGRFCLVLYTSWQRPRLPAIRTACRWHFRPLRRDFVRRVQRICQTNCWCREEG